MNYVSCYAICDYLMFFSFPDWHAKNLIMSILHVKYLIKMLY